jgi:hypothetical protein
VDGEKRKTWSSGVASLPDMGGGSRVKKKERGLACMLFLAGEKVGRMVW